MAALERLERQIWVAALLRSLNQQTYARPMMIYLHRATTSDRFGDSVTECAHIAMSAVP
jgi:hypothetical protein